MFTDYGDTENLVLARFRQYFHNTVVIAVSNGSVQILNSVYCQFIRWVLLFGVGFVQLDTGHFRIGKNGPGNGSVIGATFLEHAEQGIDGGIPDPVCGGVRELIRPCDITHCINIREVRLQVVVGGYGAVLVQADSVTFNCRDCDVLASRPQGLFLHPSDAGNPVV